jgi:hypothetical protein
MENSSQQWQSVSSTAVTRYPCIGGSSSKAAQFEFASLYRVKISDHFMGVMGVPIWKLGFCQNDLAA